jgi:hypothetical protein
MEGKMKGRTRRRGRKEIMNYETHAVCCYVKGWCIK